MAILRVSTGQNYWLSILAQDIAWIISTYASKDKLKLTLRSSQRENIGKFLSYLENAIKGIEKSQNTEGKNLALDNQIIEELTAANEVYLISENQNNIINELDELKKILTDIKEKKDVSKRRLLYWNKFLNKLSNYSLKGFSNQEASHHV